MKLTDTNIYALALLFQGCDLPPERVSHKECILLTNPNNGASDPTMERLITLGLCEVDGKTLRLTKDGRTALRAREEYFASKRATPEARILALLNSFPCLRKKGLQKWDALAVAAEARAWSSGEQEAVRFVLSVWNPEEFPWSYQEGLKRWDKPSRAAFLAWAADPWWP